MWLWLCSCWISQSQARIWKVNVSLDVYKDVLKACERLGGNRQRFEVDRVQRVQRSSKNVLQITDPKCHEDHEVLHVTVVPSGI